MFYPLFCKLIPVLEPIRIDDSETSMTSRTHVVNSRTTMGPNTPMSLRKYESNKFDIKASKSSLKVDSSTPNWCFLIKMYVHRSITLINASFNIIRVEFIEIAFCNNFQQLINQATRGIYIYIYILCMYSCMQIFILAVQTSH